MASATTDMNSTSIGEPADPTGDDLASVRYDDEIVRKFLSATIFWGLIGTLIGISLASMLVVPTLTDTAPWLSFGRVWPLFTHAVVLAFVGNGIFAAIYYSTQRLCQSRMWSDSLGVLHFWGWQIIVFAAFVTLPLGATQGRAFAELEWPIDIAFAIVWIPVFGGNFMMTLLRRNERYMYVSLWFYIATIVTIGIVHIINNLAIPTGLLSSESAFSGVQDAFVQSSYGRNAVTYFLTMPMLGLMYYFLPKAAERPVYSYSLSVIHFWALAILFVWSGPHQLHNAAIPEWAMSLGILFGLMLWMPSWGGMINGWMTMRSAGEKSKSEPALKFFAAALLFYGIATLQESMFSLRAVSELGQYTESSVAHFLVASLGWCGFMIFGMAYWLMPRLFQTELWSRKIMTLHFYCAIGGILLYAIPTYAVGWMQGSMWHSIDELGNLTYPEFGETFEKIKPLLSIRIGGGLLYFLGFLSLAFNAVMTWKSRPKEYVVPVGMTSRLAADKDVRADSEVSSNLGNDVPVLDFARKLDVFATLRWHRGWEQQPVRFVALVTAAVLLATFVELTPMIMARDNTPTIASIQPFTPLELVGRNMYVSEGCCNCHTQMVRPIVSETKRYGEYSKADEYFYDAPSQWGNRRIGPDLAREGGKQGSKWHWDNLINPRKNTEGSVMPSYRHLVDQDLDFADVGLAIQSAFERGVPYSEDEIADAEANARRQGEIIAAEIVSQGGPAATHEKQAIALIAYLQRLGTDLFKTPAPADESTEKNESQSGS